MLDIADRGPVLTAGNFAMRVTNAGILGNAFFDRGLSFDPSFEFPRGSGHEALSHAELWVGAVNAEGHTRVSGGPMLEWRPTLDPEDRVRVGWAGQPGTRRGVDDDRDGAIDEEIFNDRDDDGDGEVDEDLGFPSQQVLAADYVDDRPEAVNYGYPNGEHHEPLELSVHQEAYAWSVRGYDAIAGLQFKITNHGQQRLRSLLLGLYCGLDSRARGEPAGHLNDRAETRAFSYVFDEGIARARTPGDAYSKVCIQQTVRSAPVVVDGRGGAGMPAIAVVALGHTTDPLAYMTKYGFPGARELHDRARAPGKDTTFRYSVFAQDLPPGQGGPPVLDSDRYRALAGTYSQALPRVVGDVAVLVSCGPFPYLDPGQSLEFAVAFVAAEDPDSTQARMASAVYLYHGTRVNALPDSSSDRYDVGETGINGHEICLESPDDVALSYDPHCPDKFLFELLHSCDHPICFNDCCDPGVTTHEVAYAPRRCVWTDLDCDLCTGADGRETTVHWLDPGTVPPPPAYRIVPGDHNVRIEWDNTPEVLLEAGQVGTPGFRFSGYRVYRLSEWTRESELPPPKQWQLAAAFGVDTLDRELPLAAITDTTVRFDWIRYGQKHYPIGRYRMTDLEVLNGFDYLYVVTTVAERRTQVGTATYVERLESPLVAALDSIVVPHLTARPSADRVWVVPNPYRAHAPWDRPPVPGDPFGRHIDFFGLPRAKSTIRIYTVAGDFVAQVDHDGSGGDGQAAWDLISRNGQDVESGIYLFTVDSAAGHFTGRFVLIR